MTARPLFLAAALALSSIHQAAADTPMSYLTGSGAKAYPVNALMRGMMVISVSVVVIIAVLLLWGVLARRSRSAFAAISEAPVLASSSGTSWITIGVGISTVALVVTLIWTVVVVAQIAKPALTPLTIQVTGNQWWWSVRYLSADPTQVFDTANEIHIPTGQPVRVLLASNDVIHSFWVPQLTGKTQTIPGVINETWLEADRPGRYRGQCTQFCGLQHAHMAIYVVADTPAQFAAWRANQVQAAPAPTNPALAQDAGLFVVKCGACHTVRGTEAGGTAGPDLTHLMTRATVAAGAEPNTPAGLSGWIANPQGIKPGTKMPTLYLSGGELASVRDYLETLK
jgi:cytochrome c oxidase subunit 2